VLWNSKILGIAVGVLIASGALALLAVRVDSRALAVLAMVGMGVAAVLFLLSLRRPRRVDWDRIRSEQRLWESGPLGRRWLKIRQRLEDKQKF
jgi:hypothetical protein